jgi:pyoverdine/dityrosine biosynthesis protein Dit1
MNNSATERIRNNKEPLPDYTRVLSSLSLKSENDLHLYSGFRRLIENDYKEGKGWDEIITTDVYCDEPVSNEAFIDVIENIYNTKVKDAKHLQKLTGITKESLQGLQETITDCREERFYTLIENSMRNGMKYKELMKYKASDYGLPESWVNYYNDKIDKENLIKRALFFTYNLGEIPHIRPRISDVAEIFEAPYEFVLEASKYYGDNI